MVHPVYVLMLVVAAFGFGHMIGYWRGGNRAEADATRLDWMLDDVMDDIITQARAEGWKVYKDVDPSAWRADLAGRYEEDR